jgi:hypothetical protein
MRSTSDKVSIGEKSSGLSFRRRWSKGALNEMDSRWSQETLEKSRVSEWWKMEIMVRVCGFRTAGVISRGDGGTMQVKGHHMGKR